MDAGWVQTGTEEETNKSGNTATSGTVLPKAGRLNIGNLKDSEKLTETALTRDFYVDEVALVADVAPLSDDFGPDDSLPDDYFVSDLVDGAGNPLRVTPLSARLINAAGLGVVSIFTNTRFTTATDAAITLAPGYWADGWNDAERGGIEREIGSTVGSFNVMARSIEHHGNITVPGGEVVFNAVSNITSSTTEPENPNLRYVSVIDRIYLGGESEISVAGETADDSLVSLGIGTADSAVSVNGGRIALISEEWAGKDDAVIVRTGALLDVSGGYHIDSDGEIAAAGDGGALAIEGASVVLDGEVRGYGLIGKNGGEISITADWIQVSADAPGSLEALMPGTNFAMETDLPEELAHTLTLSQDRLADTGFSRITLAGALGLTVDDNIVLTSSTVRRITPVPASENRGANTAADLGGLVDESFDIADPTLAAVVPEQAGKTGITLKAGVRYSGNENEFARLHVGEGVVIETAPEGEVTIKAPEVEMMGSILAPAGTVTLTATKLDLTLGNASRIDVAGCVSSGSESLYPGFPDIPGDMVVRDGGTISLNAEMGKLIVPDGSLLDVSGSDPTVQYYRDNSATAPYGVTVAGAAGTVNLRYNTGLELDGTLRADTQLEGIAGGTLSLTSLGIGAALTLGPEDFQRYSASGFDSMAFASNGSLVFADNRFDAAAPIQVGRYLKLSAPVIDTGAGNGIHLHATHIVLGNDFLPDTEPQPQAGASTLSLTADWIDVEGSVAVSNADTLSLNAARDLRLKEAILSNPNGGSEWAGRLATAGTMEISAQRVYPTTLSRFELAAGIRGNDGTMTGGGIRIFGTGTNTDRPIDSAGGTLVLNSETIEISGTVAAPMGQIILAGGEKDGKYLKAERIDLAEGSILTTAGDQPVFYGVLSGISWTEGTALSTTYSNYVEAVPEKGITMVGETVDVDAGAVVDTRGGGTIFSTEFMPSVSGTVNPLEGKYVIFPDNPVSGPGAAVYLSGDGIQAGVYTLLPAEKYAFLPGAVVVSEYDGTLANGEGFTTQEGYAVVAGYYTEAGTGIQGQRPRGFVVRNAESVLAEGYFNTHSLVSGGGGDLNLQADTALLNGQIQAQALSGFNGGVLSLAGRNMTFAQSGSAGETPGELRIDTRVISGKGFRLLSAGGVDTETITLERDTLLAFENMAMAASQSIDLESGASIVATGSQGAVELNSTGGLAIGSGASVSGDAVSIWASALELEGGIDAVSSLLLGSDAISLVDADYQGDLPETGMVIHQDQYIGFDGVETLTLASRSDLNFYGNVTLNAGSRLVLDADRLANPGDEAISVSITAGHVTLANTSLDREGYVEAAMPDKAVNGTLSITATDRMELVLGMMNDDGAEAGAANDLHIEGFRDADLTGGGEIVARGTGVLATGGNLDLNAARITVDSLKWTETSEDQDAVVHHVPADVTVRAADGTIGVLAGESPLPAYDHSPGGSLAFEAKNYKQTGRVEMAGGTVSVKATPVLDEGGDITLGAGAEIIAAGTATAPGGWIDLYTARSDYYIARQDLYNDDGDLYVAQGGFYTAREDLFTAQGDIFASHGDLYHSRGSLSIAADALLDVSAGTQGNAGGIRLTAPTSTLSTVGDLRGGGAEALQGGAFYLDAAGLRDFSELVANISDFNRVVDIRVRDGDLTLGQSDTISAHYIGLRADTGNIDLLGTLDASADTGGGTIEVHSGGDYLALLNTGRLIARGTGAGASGGNVYLGTTDGILLQLGGAIDVSAAEPDGRGGTVSYRAPRLENNPNAVNMLLMGTVAGARAVVAEAFTIYQDDKITKNEIKAGTQWQAGGVYWQETKDFMDLVEANGVEDRLMAGLTLTGLRGDGTWGILDSTEKDAIFTLAPGIEIQSAGDLELSTDWDLSSGSDQWVQDNQGNWTKVTIFDWRYGENRDIPGVITLRAAGNLTLNGSLVDHPASSIYGDYAGLPNGAGRDSWGINLVAGAEIDGADPLSTGEDHGTLTIAGNRLVYTESAPVRFAAAGDVVLGNYTTSAPKFMINDSITYNIGTYDGSISGIAGGDLTIGTKGAIQAASGNIRLQVGGDLFLDDYAAIRTTGEIASFDWYYPEYWTAHSGGSIDIAVGGNLILDMAQGVDNAWDQAPYQDIWSDTGEYHTTDWGARYETKNGKYATAGISAMGGGSIRVATGGDFSAAASTFGTGDLTILSGGDMDGRFLVAEGTGTLAAMGDFGLSLSDPSIELRDARFSLTVQGSIALGTVVNPTLVNREFSANEEWNLTYQYTDAARGTLSTRIDLTAVSGDVSLSGKTSDGGDASAKRRVLPPIVNIRAGGDIRIQNDFVLAPAEDGNLALEAGGSISGAYTSADGRNLVGSVMLSDLPPEDVYGLFLTNDGLKAQYNVPYMNDLIFRNNVHGTRIVGAESRESILVSAQGDISDINLYFSKQADIVAGGDISDIYYVGQNLNGGDRTRIKAGGDIQFATATGNNESTGIILAGPGTLLVQAGNRIDLGTTEGITTAGNLKRDILPTRGADIQLVMGTDRDLGPEDIDAFFDSLREAGVEYSQLLAEGDTAGAKAVVAAARADIVDPFFPGVTGAGSLDMLRSQISTMDGGTVSIVGTGDINVGLSTFTSDEEKASTGITTQYGGDINIYSEADINVNEARVMTWYGGDITAISNTGNINAGRGSKTEVSASSSRINIEYEMDGDKVALDEYGQPIIKSKTLEPMNAAVGSGIRALTYDPDGPEGPMTAPDLGDIYLFAFDGEIDAGEAGISGANVFLGAERILNAENISFTQGSVGVPTDGGDASMGALAGSGGLSDTQGLGEDTAAVNSAQQRAAEAENTLAEAFVPRWLDVKVISFENTSAVDEDRKDD